MWINRASWPKTMSIIIFVLAVLIESVASAKIQTQTIDYQHQGVALRGHFAFDDAIPGKRPGVLVVHEWWGLNDYARDRARQLAELGYVAFAVDMYGKGKSTTEKHEARAWATELGTSKSKYERAMAGLEALRQHERVDPNRIAAIGYCFGGTTVLSLAMGGADLQGVVSFHGNLPLTDPDSQAKVKIRAKILVCHGAKDAFIPAQRISDFQDALHQGGADWQFIAYGEAVHSFTNPKAAGSGIPGVNYNAAADRRSWQHMRLFFDELLSASGESQ